MDKLKICSKCKTPKSTSEFHKDKYKTSGLCSQCKLCKTEAAKLWGATNKEKRAANHRKWAADNREKLNIKNRLWQEENKDYVKQYRLKNKEKYKMQALARGTYWTEEKYKLAILTQDNKCAICKREMVTPHADHNHKTKQPRELLCVKCNALLGFSCEDPQILASAVAYLQKHAIAISN